MEEKRIGEIVRKVYDEAKKSCVSDAKSALAIHVEGEIFKNRKKNISYRTVERAFERHIFNDKTVSERNSESINLLCEYLGFDNYQDYVKKNSHKTGGGRKKPGKWKLIISISVVFGAILTTAFIFKNQLFLGDNDLPTNNETIDNTINPNIDTHLIENKCMTWADSLYIPISCNTAPLSKYGTKVEPLIKIKLKNMKKVDVNAAYTFFSEDGKPLIWYYKNKEGEIEYFTAPGLHPVTGETLKKITPYIIETYVPIHQNKSSSFLTDDS